MDQSDEISKALHTLKRYGVDRVGAPPPEVTKILHYLMSHEPWSHYGSGDDYVPVRKAVLKWMKEELGVDHTNPWVLYTNDGGVL